MNITISIIQRRRAVASISGKVDTVLYMYEPSFTDRLLCHNQRRTWRWAMHGILNTLIYLVIYRPVWDNPTLLYEFLRSRNLRPRQHRCCASLYGKQGGTMKSRAILTVLGQDRVGIVAGVSRVLAENGVNIEDISQTIMQDFFTMIMLVTVDEEENSFMGLQNKLDEIAVQLGVKITVQKEDIFRYMHRL
jgi:ACT domain-containing protein